MDLAHGFKLDVPPIVVPWGSTYDDVQALFTAACPDLEALFDCGEGWYTVAVESLGGLRHRLGLQFSAPPESRLVELNFAIFTEPDTRKSFAEFQRYFEREFGEPTRHHDGSEFPDCTWEVDGCVIMHYVYDRFGPVERLIIRPGSDERTKDIHAPED